MTEAPNSSSAPPERRKRPGLRFRVAGRSFEQPSPEVCWHPYRFFIAPPLEPPALPLRCRERHFPHHGDPITNVGATDGFSLPGGPSCQLWAFLLRTQSRPRHSLAVRTHPGLTVEPLAVLLGTSTGASSDHPLPSTSSRGSTPAPRLGSHPAAAPATLLTMFARWSAAALTRRATCSGRRRLRRRPRTGRNGTADSRYREVYRVESRSTSQSNRLCSRQAS
jgi:hypothetical protein